MCGFLIVFIVVLLIFGGISVSFSSKNRINSKVFKCKECNNNDLTFGEFVYNDKIYKHYCNKCQHPVEVVNIKN